MKALAELFGIARARGWKVHLTITAGEPSELDMLRVVNRDGATVAETDVLTNGVDYAASELILLVEAEAA